MPETILLIFVKNKIRGSVKTRLAADLGKDKALSIYQSLCRYTREICAPLPFTKHVYYSNYIEKQDEWNVQSFQKFVQKGNDLGERMTNAFSQAFQQADHVMIIGTDCPGLQSQHIYKAGEALKLVDVVIGPALDGGYYLLGMNKLYPELFQDINWSSSKVLRQTLQKIGKLALSCKLLEELADIDYKEDWEKYGWKPI